MSCLIFLAACAGLDRGPSSIKSSDSLLNLFNSEEILKASYRFDLISLYDLNEKKLNFKSYEINGLEAKKAVESWMADLSGFLTVYKEEIKVRSGTREIPVNVRDLTRLQQALSLLSKSGESQQRILKKQIELISAYNQNFKLPENFNYAASSIPLEISATSKNRAVFSDSSFWSGRERKQNLNPLEIPAEELSNRNCRAESTEAVNFARVICGNLQFKIFPQISPKVSVLNSILYRRFGYNSAPIAFVKQMSVKYERSLLPVLKKLNVPVSAILKSGDAVSLDGFISKLLPYCSSRDEKCFSASALFDPDIEAQVDKLLLSDVALNIDHGDHVFGFWAYEELDHRFRPEVRALLIISAFTGNSDLRKNGNAVVWSAKNFTVSHQIQNLNSGLGGVRPGSKMNLNAFSWHVLKSKKINGKSVLIFDGYRPSVNRQAFSEVSTEDAKWAVRQIAGLSEQELTEALALSGFSAAELLLAREKLLSVQKNMIESLDLTGEFATVTERKIEKNINYRLTGQPAIFEVTANRRIEVPEGNDELINGVLKKGATSPLLENKRKISNTVDK